MSCNAANCNMSVFAASMASMTAIGESHQFMQVPKMLGALRSTWAPEAFITSFKLETDEQILISKVMRVISLL